MAAVLLAGGAPPGALDDSGMLPEQCEPATLDAHNEHARRAMQTLPRWEACYARRARDGHGVLAERLRARRAATGCSELARAADTGDASAVREALADGAPPGADALQAAATGGHVLAVRELVKGAAIRRR